MGTWTSAYIHKPGELTLDNVKSLAKDAGVHFYSNKNVPVFANNRYVSIHRGKADKDFIIHFPQTYNKITELFSNKEYFATNSINLSFNMPETFLFLTE
jgi:hypothetical protein